MKYVLFIMRADNKGEGGIMALTALALRTCYVFRSPRSEALAHTANGEALRSSRS